MALTDRIRGAIVSATARARDTESLEQTQEQLRKRRRARERQRAERERSEREQRRAQQREQAETERERQQRREAASEAVDEATELAASTRVGRGASRVGSGVSRAASGLRQRSPGVRNVLESAAERVDTDTVGVRSRDDDTAERAERAAASPAVISDATLDPFGGEADPMTGPAQLQALAGGVGRPPRNANPLVVEDQIVGGTAGRAAEMGRMSGGDTTGGVAELAVGGRNSGDDGDGLDSMAEFVVGGDGR